MDMIVCLPDILKTLTEMGYNAEENVSIKRVTYFGGVFKIGFKVCCQDEYVGIWDPIAKKFKED